MKIHISNKCTISLGENIQVPVYIANTKDNVIFEYKLIGSSRPKESTRTTTNIFPIESIVLHNKYIQDDSSYMCEFVSNLDEDSKISIENISPQVYRLQIIKQNSVKMHILHSAYTVWG
jgi:hypothetical protein